MGACLVGLWGCTYHRDAAVLHLGLAVQLHVVERSAGKAERVELAHRHERARQAVAELLAVRDPAVRAHGRQRRVLKRHILRLVAFAGELRRRGRGLGCGLDGLRIRRAQGGACCMVRSRHEGRGRGERERKDKLHGAV